MFLELRIIMVSKEGYVYTGAAAVCTGATGAWTPTEIFQWVPGTRPEKKLGFKRTTFFKN